MVKEDASKVSADAFFQSIGTLRKTDLAFRAGHREALYRSLAPLRFDEPFLRQRSYAKFTPLMCKPSLKFVPADWVLRLPAGLEHTRRAPEDFVSAQ